MYVNALLACSAVNLLQATCERVQAQLEAKEADFKTAVQQRSEVISELRSIRHKVASEDRDFENLKKENHRLEAIIADFKVTGLLLL